MCTFLAKTPTIFEKIHTWSLRKLQQLSLKKLKLFSWYVMMICLMMAFTQATQSYILCHLLRRTGFSSLHINMIYFFVTDHINSNELSITYFPTEMMAADFYTKPLGGKLFRLFRALILCASFSFELKTQPRSQGHYSQLPRRK